MDDEERTSAKGPTTTTSPGEKVLLPARKCSDRSLRLWRNDRSPPGAFFPRRLPPPRSPRALTTYPAPAAFGSSDGSHGAHPPASIDLRAPSRGMRAVARRFVGRGAPRRASPGASRLAFGFRDARARRALSRAFDPALTHPPRASPPRPGFLPAESRAGPGGAHGEAAPPGGRPGWTPAVRAPPPPSQAPLAARAFAFSVFLDPLDAIFEVRLAHPSSPASPFLSSLSDASTRTCT